VYNTIEETVECDTTVLVELTLYIDPENTEFVDFVIANLNRNQDFEVESNY